MDDERYYIGEVEKICNISKKTLRYYDKIGLLSPKEILSSNGYRHYNKEDICKIPVIKYYKQSGFQLENIKQLIYSSDYLNIERSFNYKIEELEEMEKELQMKKKSLEDWNSLVKEARMVIDNNICNIGVKYLAKNEMLFLEQEFKYDYISSIINIEFTNYIEEIDNAITGPVIIQFPSFEDKIQGNCKSIKIIQKNLKKCDEDKLIEFGGGLVISCYYLGAHKNIGEAYSKIKEWIKLHNYKCEDECYERYVIDYWTTNDENKFVTEIIIKLKNNQK